MSFTLHIRRRIILTSSEDRFAVASRIRLSQARAVTDVVAPDELWPAADWTSLP